MCTQQFLWSLPVTLFGPLCAVSCIPYVAASRHTVLCIHSRAKCPQTRSCRMFSAWVVLWDKVFFPLFLIFARHMWCSLRWRQYHGCTLNMRAKFTPWCASQQSCDNCKNLSCPVCCAQALSFVRAEFLSGTSVICCLAVLSSLRILQDADGFRISLWCPILVS